MNTIALQPTQTISRHYPVTERKLSNQERKQPKYVTIPVEKEETSQSIAFLTQYMEDLKAGKLVENISPSNDPYYLVPENIAQMIESDKSMLKGYAIGRVIESVDELWKDLDIE